MHYSECNCFLGQAKQQLCYKHKVGNSIGFGALGTVLGILTAIGFYVSYLLFLDKTEPVLPDSNNEKIKIDEDHSKHGHKDKENHLHDDDLVLEDVKSNEKVHVKQHSHGHKHRKCWACEVKYNGATPPLFW